MLFYENFVAIIMFITLCCVGCVELRVVLVAFSCIVATEGNLGSDSWIVLSEKAYFLVVSIQW